MQLNTTRAPCIVLHACVDKNVHLLLMAVIPKIHIYPKPYADARVYFPILDSHPSSYDNRPMLS